MQKVQESLFRNLFDSMLANVNSGIDGMIKDLTGLKSSYSFRRKTLKTSSPWPSKMTTIEKRRGLTTTLSGLLLLQNGVFWKPEPQGQYSCWFNAWGTCWNTERKAKVALISKLTLSFEVQIERAHRTVNANRGQADGGNASFKRPALLFVVWRTQSKKSYIKGGEESEA